MKKEIKYNKLFNVRLSEKLIDDYKKYCEENGFLMSKRIRFIIQKDLEENLIIKK